MTRVRTTNYGGWPQGKLLWTASDGNTAIYTGASGSAGYSRCDDVPGPGDGQALNIRHFSKQLGSVSTNGKPWGPSMGWHPLAVSQASAGHNTLVGSPSNQDIAVATMAGTNPSRPVTDIPIAVLELGDVVKLVKSLGSSAIEKAAGLNISYQFAIKPMVNDLLGILQFSKHIDDRVEELKRLQKQGGITRSWRKKVPYNTTASSSGVALINSSPPSLTATWSSSTKELAWGIAKWRANDGFPHPGNADALRALAKKAVYGLTLDASTAWELIPWSWLVDYGINVGKYFAAHRNVVPASCTALYVCRNLETDLVYQPSKNQNLVYSSWGTRTAEKNRFPVSFVTPSAHLPFLTGGQMSIIASLGVLKGAK